MFSGTDDAWQRVVRRRHSATEDDACCPAFWQSRRGDYLGLGTCGSIVPALRGTGPVLAHVTRRSVRSLLGHAPSLRMSWPVRPWVTLDSLLALGCVARIGALRALVDSGRTGRPVLGHYSLYQRPEGHALLRVVPRGPAVVRARGPASASGHTAVRWASHAPQPHAGRSGFLPSMECLVYLGANPDDVVAHLADGFDLLLFKVSDSSMLLGLQLYRAVLLDNVRSEWLPSLFDIQELAVVYWRGQRLDVDWTSAALTAVEPTWTAGEPVVQGRSLRPLPQPVWRRLFVPSLADLRARLSGHLRAATPAPRRLQQRLARLWCLPPCRAPTSPTARADLAGQQAPAAAEGAASPCSTFVGCLGERSADAARSGLAAASSLNGTRSPRELSGDPQNGSQLAIPGPAALGANASRSLTCAPVCGSIEADWEWAPWSWGRTA